MSNGFVAIGNFVSRISLMSVLFRSRLLSGCIRMPDMSVHSIESTTLRMSHIASGNSPKEVHFEIKSIAKF